MILETDRLILRPWTEQDAESLYKYAKDPLVGPIAGFPVHTSVENSREIIKNVLLAPETYAVVHKEDNEVIGSLGLMIREKSSIAKDETEAEIGYWVGVPFWGKGYIPEAIRRVLQYAFEILQLKIIWCGYYEGNEKSKRAQEKCGFTYCHQVMNKKVPLLNEERNLYVTQITKEQWEVNISKEKGL